MYDGERSSSSSWQLADLAGKASSFSAQDFRVELSQLLANGADINTTEHLESGGKPPLRQCCESAGIDVSSGSAFRSILEAGAEVDQFAAVDGRTALHIAAATGKTIQVEALLEYGADPSLKTTRVTGADVTAVTTAAALAKQAGHAKVVALLDHNRFMQAGMRVMVQGYGSHFIPAGLYGGEGALYGEGITHILFLLARCNIFTTFSLLRMLSGVIKKVHKRGLLTKHSSYTIEFEKSEGSPLPVAVKLTLEWMGKREELHAFRTMEVSSITKAVR
jgi:hypothetical protein